MQSGSQFLMGRHRADGHIGQRMQRIQTVRKGLLSLLLPFLFQNLFGRSGDREMAGRAGFTGIVYRLRTAGLMRGLAQRILRGNMLRPGGGYDPQASRENNTTPSQIAAATHMLTVMPVADETQERRKARSYPIKVFTRKPAQRSRR